MEALLNGFIDLLTFVFHQSSTLSSISVNKYSCIHSNSFFLRLNTGENMYSCFFFYSRIILLIKTKLVLEFGPMFRTCLEQSQPEASLLLTPLHQSAFSLYFSLRISCRTDKENMLNNQELFSPPT